MTKEDLIVLCEEAIDELEGENKEQQAWKNLHEIRAWLVNN